VSHIGGRYGRQDLHLRWRVVEILVSGPHAMFGAGLPSTAGLNLLLGR
jgi:hypothetical protein